MNLYLTADKLGEWTGGSQVVSNESQALQELGPCEVWDRDVLAGGSDPWGWDEVACKKLTNTLFLEPFKLCHVYAGCFTKTVALLQRNGCKVCYTVAAHDVDRSRQAHLDMGLVFPYEHLNDPGLFRNYIGGYLLADCVVCPGSVPAATVRRQGCTGRVEVIPHGIDLPKCSRCDGDGEAHGSDRPFEWSEKSGYPGLCPVCRGDGTLPLKPLPQQFIVGYLGSFGADKGVKTLLEAWRKLSLPDAVLLLGGRDSASPFVGEMVRRWGGGNVVQAGWQDNPWDFMDQISCYVQPSATEGFGIEMLEAMARDRVVISSDQNAGPDLLDGGLIFPAGDVEQLASKIDSARKYLDVGLIGHNNAQRAKQFTWTAVRERYKALWSEMLK